MDNSDERDYAGEAESRALIEQGDESGDEGAMIADYLQRHPGTDPRKARYLASVEREKDPYRNRGAYLSAGRAALGQGPQPEPARIPVVRVDEGAVSYLRFAGPGETSDDVPPHALHIQQGGPTPQMGGGWWIAESEGAAFRLGATNRGLQLACASCGCETWLTYDGSFITLGLLMKSICTHRADRHDGLTIE